VAVVLCQVRDTTIKVVLVALAPLSYNAKILNISYVWQKFPDPPPKILIL
jgi:hypothetical protein